MRSTLQLSYGGEIKRQALTLPAADCLFCAEFLKHLIELFGRHFLKRSILLFRDNRTNLLSLHLGSSGFLRSLDCGKLLSDDMFDDVNLHVEVNIFVLLVSEQRLFFVLSRYNRQGRRSR